MAKNKMKRAPKSSPHDRMIKSTHTTNWNNHNTSNNKNLHPAPSPYPSPTAGDWCSSSKNMNLVHSTIDGNGGEEKPLHVPSSSSAFSCSSSFPSSSSFTSSSSTMYDMKVNEKGDHSNSTTCTSTRAQRNSHQEGTIHSSCSTGYNHYKKHTRLKRAIFEMRSEAFTYFQQSWKEVERRRGLAMLKEETAPATASASRMPNSFPSHDHCSSNNIPHDYREGEVDDTSSRIIMKNSPRAVPMSLIHQMEDLYTKMDAAIQARKHNRVKVLKGALVLRQHRLRKWLLKKGQQSQSWPRPPHLHSYNSYLNPSIAQEWNTTCSNASGGVPATSMDAHLSSSVPFSSSSSVHQESPTPHWTSEEKEGKEGEVSPRPPRVFCSFIPDITKLPLPQGQGGKASLPPFCLSSSPSLPPPPTATPAVTTSYDERPAPPPPHPRPRRTGPHGSTKGTQTKTGDKSGSGDGEIKDVEEGQIVSNPATDSVPGGVAGVPLVIDEEVGSQALLSATVASPPPWWPPDCRHFQRYPLLLSCAAVEKLHRQWAVNPSTGMTMGEECDNRFRPDGRARSTVAATATPTRTGKEDWGVETLRTREDNRDRGGGGAGAAMMNRDASPTQGGKKGDDESVDGVPTTTTTAASSFSFLPSALQQKLLWWEEGIEQASKPHLEEKAQGCCNSEKNENTKNKKNGRNGPRVPGIPQTLMQTTPSSSAPEKTSTRKELEKIGEHYEAGLSLSRKQQKKEQVSSQERKPPPLPLSSLLMKSPFMHTNQTNIITDALDDLAFTTLHYLYEEQHALRKKNPLHYKSRQRYVSGFHEVLKWLRAGRLQLVLLASDIERWERPPQISSVQEEKEGDAKGGEMEESAAGKQACLSSPPPPPQPPSSLSQRKTFHSIGEAIDAIQAGCGLPVTRNEKGHDASLNNNDRGTNRINATTTTSSDGNNNAPLCITCLTRRSMAYALMCKGKCQVACVGIAQAEKYHYLLKALKNYGKDLSTAFSFTSY